MNSSYSSHRSFGTHHPQSCTSPSTGNSRQHYRRGSSRFRRGDKNSRWCSFGCSRKCSRLSQGRRRICRVHGISSTDRLCSSSSRGRTSILRTWSTKHTRQNIRPWIHSESILIPRLLQRSFGRLHQLCWHSCQCRLCSKLQFDRLRSLKLCRRCIALCSQKINFRGKHKLH